MTHSKEAWAKVIRAGFDPAKLPKNVSLPEAVIAAQKLFVEHVEQSAGIAAYLTELPKGTGTCCPDSPLDKLVRYLAARRETIDKSDPLVTLKFIRELVMPAMVFEHEIACRVARFSNDMSKAESIILHQGDNTLALATNLLWLKWFEALVVPYQLLSPEERAIWDKVFEDQLSKYDYTVFELGPDHTIVNRQPWAVAFPDEIVAICSGLTFLKQSLQEARFDQPETMQFLDALMAAYVCKEIEPLEELWANVDRAWVVIPPDCRTMIVYGMESGYEHPRGVSPELRVDIRTTFSQDLIASVRAEVTAYTEQHYPMDLELLLQKLSCLDVAIFAQTIGAGVQCDFRYLGQAVPNRQDITSNIGMRIFVDQNGLQNTADLLHRRIDEHCTPKTAALLKSLIDSTAVNRFTQGHEHSHPVARTPDGDQALGDAFRLLEECKASVFGELATFQANPEYAKVIVAHFIGRMLRLLDKNKLEDPTFAAYVRDALVHANLMLGCSVIRLTDQGISVNLEETAVSDWFCELGYFLSQVITAYHDSNGQKLEQLAAEYCGRSDGDVAKLISWINRQ